MKLNEIVAPTADLQLAILYHGTPTRAGYEGILRQGLKFDPAAAAQKYQGQEAFAPLPGVYLTKDFGNAVRYSFMSQVPDENYAAYIKTEPTGYVFEFSGQGLSSVSPDEDELGRLIEKLVKIKDLPANLSQLIQTIPQNLRNQLQQDQVNFETVAVAGKWATSKLSSATIQYLLKRYANVVSYGAIKPSAVWIIPKPTERFLRDRQGTFDTFNGYTNYAKRFGKRNTV